MTINKSRHAKGCSYTKDKIIHGMDCPKCMEIWCDFINKENLLGIGPD